MRFWAVVSVCALLAGCGLTAPKGVDAPGAGENPVTGDAIAVTSLDAPAAAEPVAAAAEPAAKPLVAEAAAVEPEVPAEPARVISAEEAACVKKGGSWSATGTSGARACVKRTRDSGKHCTRAGDCEGSCLARSNTCAPVVPLFGCNDVLQDNGVMVTLCIE